MSNTTTKTPDASFPQEEAYLHWFNQEKEKRFGGRVRYVALEEIHVNM